VLALPLFEPPLYDAVRNLVEGDLEMAPRERVLHAGLLLDELLEMAVEPFAVNRIDGVFHDLQPVARDDGAAHHPDGGIGDVTVEPGDERRGQRAHIREEQAAELRDGITAGLDLVLERAALGFVGLVDALTGPVVHPTVIRAADPRFGRNAIRERGAPVRTGFGDQSEPAEPVFEQDEILAEQTDALRPAVR